MLFAKDVLSANELAIVESALRKCDFSRRPFWRVAPDLPATSVRDRGLPKPMPVYEFRVEPVERQHGDGRPTEKAVAIMWKDMIVEILAPGA